MDQGSTILSEVQVIVWGASSTADVPLENHKVCCVRMAPLDRGSRTSYI